MNIDIHCKCSWAGHDCESGSADQPQVSSASPTLPARLPATTWQVPSESGLLKFQVEPTLGMKGPVLRVGKVWYLCPGVGTFERATLRLYANGFTIVRKLKDADANIVETSVAWSPFTNVQACRLHSEKADEDFPWLRLFKVSIFHFCDTYYFAARNAKQPIRPSLESEAVAALVEELAEDNKFERHETLQGDADVERVRWVADIARALRAFTYSLFPAFQLAVEPLPNRDTTHKRLLAGYVLLCLQFEVQLVYLEMGAYSDGVVPFIAYEDDSCNREVLRISMTLSSSVTDRAGVDCSCFSVEGYSFLASSVAEKRLWLRVISNVKVKLRHNAAAPSSRELQIFRDCIGECARSIKKADTGHIAVEAPLLPRSRIKDKSCESTSQSSPSFAETRDDNVEDDKNMRDVAEEDIPSQWSGLPLEVLAYSCDTPSSPSRLVSLGNASDREFSLLSNSDVSQLGEPLAEPEPAKLPIAAIPSQSRSSSCKAPSALLHIGKQHFY